VEALTVTPGIKELVFAGASAILLVDDDGANRTIAKALLESDKHTLVEARDGVEALELLQSVRAFSLAVLDLEMPRLGGREVLKEICGSMAPGGVAGGGADRDYRP
jgi:CheY-like chemotaxis protein